MVFGYQQVNFDTIEIASLARLVATVLLVPINLVAMDSDVIAHRHRRRVDDVDRLEKTEKRGNAKVGYEKQVNR